MPGTHRKAASGTRDAVVGAAVELSGHGLLHLENAHHLRHRRSLHLNEHLRFFGEALFAVFFLDVFLFGANSPSREASRAIMDTVKNGLAGGSSAALAVALL